MAAKQERRAYFRGLQLTFSQEQYRKWNEGLAPHLLEVIGSVEPHAFLAVYQARPKEASPHPLFSLSYRFCFPKITGRNGTMEFRYVARAGEPEEFVPGPFGILEPTETHPVVTKSEIAACFVPLLAFDGEGRRLGHGKGYYDRFLEDFSGLKIGVAFEWQFSPEALPMEDHDVHLDMVVTEHGVRRFTP